MKTSTSRAFKAHVSLWKFFAALLLAWICVPMSQASAQNTGEEVACWVLTKPTVNGKGRGTLTFTTYAGGGNLYGKKLYNNQVVDATSPDGVEILDGAPIDANCTPEWTEKSTVSKEEINTVVFDASFAQFRPTSCAKWFYGCAFLTEIEGIEHLNTEYVTNMSEMFYDCAALQDINLKHFKTANVEDMSNMFAYCIALTSLDLSSFDTENVTTTEGMFAKCSSLLTLDLRNFHPWSLTNTHAMFLSCSELQSIFAVELFTKNITDGHDMFLGCYNLVGAAKYDEKNTDATMANGLEGYFMPHFTDGNGNVTYFEKDENNRIVLNLSDANPFSVTKAYNIYKGTYTRKSMPSYWGTVCVPFIIDVKSTETNCEIYTFKKVEGENLFIEKIEKGEIAAGTPVIVKGTKDSDLKVCSPERDQTIVTEPVPGGTGTSRIKGTFEGQELKGTSNYFIAKDKFWQVTGYDTPGNTIAGVKVPPFRATITTESTQAPSLGIVVVGETNSIGQTPTVEDLLSDKAEYFDLQGRRLDGPQKGINLVRMGGKTRKVVIK